MGNDLVLQIPKKASVRFMAVSSVTCLVFIVGLLAIPGMWDHWFLFLIVILALMYSVYVAIRDFREPMIVFARDDITIVHRDGPTKKISYLEVSNVRERWDDIYITFKNGEKMVLTPGMGDIKLAPLFIATVNPDADIDDRVLMGYPFYGQKIPVRKLDRCR